MFDSVPNKRLERTRHERASLVSNLGEPLKRIYSMLLGDPEMSPSAEIIYREFYDVPRIFVASFGGKQYLFDCKFDESANDYPDVYQVYVLPNLGNHDLNGSWDGLSERAQEYLGEVLVKQVVFDESKRRAIDPRVIEEVASASS